MTAGSARDDILSRLRRVTGAGLDFRGAGEDEPPRPPSAVTDAAGDAAALGTRFGQELERVLGSYEIVDRDRAVTAVVDRINEWIEREQGGVDARSVLSWAPDELPIPGLAEGLHAAGISLMVPADLGDPAQRSAAAAVATGLTSVEAAFAGTGSMLLTPSAARSRAASLLPARHLVLVPFSRLFATVEAWLAHLRHTGRLASLLRDRRQWAFVTGPSKSADIELNLTVGVHGPGAVHAVLFDDR